MLAIGLGSMLGCCTVGKHCELLHCKLHFAATKHMLGSDYKYVWLSYDSSPLYDLVFRQVAKGGKGMRCNGLNASV